jgi:hypothetical protein
MLQKMKGKEPQDQLLISMAKHKLAVVPVKNGRNRSIRAFIPACYSNGNDGDDKNIPKKLQVTCHLHFDGCDCNGSWLNSTIAPFLTQRECNAVDHSVASHSENYDRWIVSNIELPNFYSLSCTCTYLLF